MIRKNLSLFPFLLLFMLFLTTFSFSQQKGSLEKIVISKTEKTLEVRVLLSVFSYYRQFELTGPNRVVIDFIDTRGIKAPRFLRVNALGVRGIRTGQFKPSTARVVFDMIDETPPYKIETIRNGLRILFWPEEEVIEEKIEIEDAICDIKVNPVKANLNDLIYVDMSGSLHAKSMEVEVFAKEGIKIASQKLTPEIPIWETRFDKPGEYFFKGKAFNTAGKPTENLCEARTYINFPPVSKLECSPCTDKILKPITLDATGSSDPDGQVIRIDFEITDEEGNLVDRFTDNEMPFTWEKVFEDKGKYAVTAISTDDYGAVSEPAAVDVVARKGKKRVFLLLDAYGLFARGQGIYIGYGGGRLGIVFEIFPGTLDITISGGGAYTEPRGPWKIFYHGSLLFNLHVGPIFIGAGAGFTTQGKETLPKSYGEAIANIGIDMFSIGKTKVSILFEAMGPITDYSIEDHYKVAGGFRLKF